VAPFIPGVLTKSWENWIRMFSDKGYNCHAPAWPLHEGDPRSLRDNPPPGLGELRLKDVIASIEATVRGLGRPVMIGHSVGGLITQILLSRGLLSAGVAIDPSRPMPWSTLTGAFSRTARSSPIR
jgi:pimeloyl-ACP methyl ester carboxylesterase